MKNSQTIETIFEELESILEKIKDVDTPLEDSIELYAKAAVFLQDAHTLLKETELKFEEITADIKNIEIDNEL